VRTVEELGFRVKGLGYSNEAAAGLARALGRAARLADNQQQVVTTAGEDC
jgi:hypothetical protein